MLETSFGFRDILLASISAIALGGGCGSSSGDGVQSVDAGSPDGGTLDAGADTGTSTANGSTVYDAKNNVSWLADANLPASNRFGLPVCTASRKEPCINPSGSMGYRSATAWVAAMNAAAYLGRTSWQLPTTPEKESGCTSTGPNGSSFGFGCTANALGSLYGDVLGIKAPNTAVPITKSTAGPFVNFQPYLYWSGRSAGGKGNSTLSFNSGFQGANTQFNFLYLLPMIPGKIPGTPPASGTKLQVNPDGKSVYDPIADVTWAEDANLAATNAFGLPACTSHDTPSVCVNQDGAMNLASATQFVANMNSDKGTGYLGQTTWQLPPMDPSCDASFDCLGTMNPLAELYYGQLGLSAGAPVVAAPNTTVGGFMHIQPYLYWSCEGATIQSPCQTNGPANNFEWSFSFGNGFLGTDILMNDLFVTAYFVGR